MKILINERLSEHKYKTPEGYLICTDAILARTGKQEYRRAEVFGDSCDDADKVIEIDRIEEEVFSPATLASFENKPITVEHPDVDVNSDNYKDYSVGFVRDVKRGKVDGQDVILGTLVITDRQTIEEIENGEHTDLSCGYDCDIIDEDNPQQRNIRGNHVALCAQGRAGIARIVDTAMNDEYNYSELKREIKKRYNSLNTSYSEKEIYDAIVKLHNQKPFMEIYDCMLKVLDNIRNGNYLLDSVKDEPSWFKELAIKAKNYYSKQQKEVYWNDIANYIKSHTGGYSLTQISWWIDDFSKKNPNFLKDSVKDEYELFSDEQLKRIKEICEKYDLSFDDSCCRIVENYNAAVFHQGIDLDNIISDFETDISEAAKENNYFDDSIKDDNYNVYGEYIDKQNNHKQFDKTFSTYQKALDFYTSIMNGDYKYYSIDMEKDGKNLANDYHGKPNDSIKDDKPFTYSQILQEIKMDTQNFTQKDGEFRYGYEEEAKHAIKILRTRYNVDINFIDDRRSPSGETFIVKFSKTKQFDSIIDTSMTVTTQVYIFNGHNLLIQNRKGKVWRGLAVPGGHVRHDEPAAISAIREVKEETGLDVKNLVLFGTHQYTCPEDGESIAMLYCTTNFSGELKSSEEGEVSWMNIENVLENPHAAEGFTKLAHKAWTKVKEKGLINDADFNSIIDALIADEEEAIRGYEEAMKNADEKHKALYSHIINEELEHIEELKNMKEMKDSIKDSRKTKVEKIINVLAGVKDFIKDSNEKEHDYQIIFVNSDDRSNIEEIKAKNEEEAKKKLKEKYGKRIYRIVQINVLDSVKDKKWEVGNRVKYDGQWYYIINYSKGEWILQAENSREQIRVQDSIKDSYYKFEQWFDYVYDECKYDFVNGGYGMKFKTFNDYQKAKNYAQKIKLDEGWFNDKEMTYWNYKSERIGNDSVKDSNLRKSKLRVGQIIHLDPAYNERVKDKELLNDDYKVLGFWYDNKLITEDKAPEAIMDFSGIQIQNMRTKMKYNLNRFQLMDNVKDDSIKDVNPIQGESKEDFIARFMKETKSEYPDEKQRYAIALSYWKGKDSKKHNVEKIVVRLNK